MEVVVRSHSVSESRQVSTHSFTQVLDLSVRVFSVILNSFFVFLLKFVWSISVIKGLRLSSETSFIPNFRSYRNFELK